MSALLLDGKLVAALRIKELKKHVTQFIQIHKKAPGLAVILIGDDPASEIYVTNKRKACAEVGIVSHSYDLPTTATQEDLLQLVTKLNNSPHIDGILI